ncbi:hypothetical protein CPC16_009468 [Podila verticillata]|nr:hypothetical protein CPC16_009468 [Podila verticillata]
MGNKSSKPKRQEWQQQVDQEPEFNPPYARSSQVMATVDVAHSMDEIRESSGFYVRPQQQRRQEREMAKIRASAMVPITSRPYYAPTTPQPYNAPTTSQPYYTPTTPQPYNAPTTSQPYYAPTRSQPYYTPNAQSNHERDMALIRESSGAHLR